MAPRRPELTVVIPTKDRPSLLPRALASVLDQVGDGQVIVVDDGSTEANAAVVRDLCAADARVTLVRNDVPAGAPHARNQGLALADGTYWATHDDDDVWLPGKWEAQRAILEREGFPEDLVVLGGIRLAHRDTPAPRDTPLVREPERFEGLSSLFAHVPLRTFTYTFVAPTQLLRDLGGWDERLVWGEYTDMLIRLGRVARFAATPHPSVLADKFHGAVRTGRNWSRKVEGLDLLLSKHEDAFRASPEIHSMYLHVLGISHLRSRRRREAAKAFWTVAARGEGATRRVRAAGHLMLTIAGPRLWQGFADVRKAEANL